MAYRLSCPFCAGSVTVDDAALRRSLVVCAHCGTVLRVGPEGLERADGSLPDRPTPPGVVVEREAPGSLSIRVRRPAGAWAVNRASGLWGAAVGLAVGAAAAAIGGAPFAALGLPAALAAFVLAAKLQRWLPPLRLREGSIHPSDPGADPLPSGSLRQIYAAVTCMHLNETDRFTSIHVLALTEGGERVVLLGPLETEEIGLFVEEALEVELRLFDLDVFGEASRPEEREGGLGQAPPASEPKAPIDCPGCGHRVTPSVGDLRRGVVTCPHCGDLSHLLPPGETRGVLGAPDAASSAFRYSIAEDEDGVSIVPGAGSSARRSIEVRGPRVTLRRSGKAPVEVRAQDLTDLAVAERSRTDREFSVDDGLEQLANASALSGDVDLRQIVLAGAGAISLDVVARHRTRGEITLADRIQDPREARLIVRTLERLLTKAK